MTGKALLPPPATGLLTDFYELTMAHAYWREGVHEEPAIFELFFRKVPFGGGFAVACGLATVAERLEGFGFDADDVAYLSGLRAADGSRLFDGGFLEHLRGVRFSGRIDATPEGTPVFAGEPLLRIEGALLECQVLESALLNAINFETLIATKAARVRLAARDDTVLEFGLRRAQGADGALTASRAAFVGGADATSNVLAGKRFGIPVRGTHAHSFVMYFRDERIAFDVFGRAMPTESILLVDTYETRAGVQHAVEVGRELRAAGIEIAGIRLDSGDLGALALEARRLLDEGGFPEARIVASGDLDEYAIAELKRRGAPIDSWGVGTRLVTAYDEPALGGVYKLVGTRDSAGRVAPRIKLSDDPAKTSVPGVHQVRRYRTQAGFRADAIYDAERGLAAGCTLVEAGPPERRHRLGDELAFEDLLVPVFREGKRILALPSPAQARARTLEQVRMLPPEVTRLVAPGRYLVGLEGRLHEEREAMMAAERRRIAQALA